MRKSSQVESRPSRRRGALGKWGLLLFGMALLTGCTLPRHTVGLDEVLEQKLGRERAHYATYRCTRGAHRGASVQYRENTLKALKAADADSRFAFVEFDVQYSKDNRIGVFHDRRLLRLFGSLRVVGETEYPNLWELTAGEVCTYEDAIRSVRKRLNIEIKSQGDDAEDARLADELIADLRARGRLKQVMISSISAEVIRYINDRHPDVATGKVIWLTSSTYLHFERLTRELYEEFTETEADYLMLYTANLRNLEGLLKFKPVGKTIVFWDFDDTMYVVHKDRSDHLWGQSWLSSCYAGWRYALHSW